MEPILSTRLRCLSFLSKTPGAETNEQEQMIDNGDPEINDPFDEDLAKLRSVKNYIEWGTKWFPLSE